MKSLRRHGRIPPLRPRRRVPERWRVAAAAFGLLVLVAFSTPAWADSPSLPGWEPPPWLWALLALVPGAGWARERWQARRATAEPLDESSIDPAAVASLRRSAETIERLVGEIHEAVAARDGDTDGLRLWQAFGRLEAGLKELAEAQRRLAIAIGRRSGDHDRR